MKALTWKQPYAALMLYGKEYETRTWSTKYRGPVLICAGKQAYSTEILKRISGKMFMEMMLTLEGTNPIDHIKGRAIATADLVDCWPMRFKDEEKAFVEFNPNLFIHHYENFQRIQPIPWKGTQGWSNVPKEIMRMIKPRQ